MQTMMIITLIIAAVVMTNLICLLLLCSVPAGDRSAAGEAAGIRAEAGRVRVSTEGSGRTGPEGADGVPEQTRGVGRAPAQTAG